MEKHKFVVRQKIKAKQSRLVAILLVGLLDIVFIWWAFAQGEVILVFLGLIVLPLLAWMFYYISKQPIR